MKGGETRQGVPSLPKLHKTNPPKDREFMGIKEFYKGDPYFEIYKWMNKSEGVDKSGYYDRGYFNMPDIDGWVDITKLYFE